MSRRKLPYTFEPLRAWRDTTWDLGYQFGPPPIDDEEVVGKWWAQRDRAEREAKVVLFGSGGWEPRVNYGLDGTPIPSPGETIVATVHPIHTDHPRAADHVQFAARVVACVNALAGVPDPEGTLALCRALLLDLAQGTADSEDPRLLRLLDRLGPDPEYTKYHRRIFGSEESGNV